MLMNAFQPSKLLPSISPQQAQQLIQAQMMQSAVQAGHIPPAVASVPPTPSLIIQLHHLVQLQQLLQRLQLQQASMYAAHQQTRLPRLPTVRPDPLAMKIAKVRQQIVALHLQIKQTCRQQQMLNAAAVASTVTQDTDTAATFDTVSRDVARELSGAAVMRDDATARWKSPMSLPDCIRNSCTAELSHSSVSQSLDAWTGWPPSLLTSPPPDCHSAGSDGLTHDISSTSSSSAALDIEEFIPGKPWQGPPIRCAEDDPFITPGDASSALIGIDECPRDVAVTSRDITGWTTSASHESTTARAPPGLVPSSSPWLHQPAFTRSTSWTPQCSYGNCLSHFGVV